MRAFIENCAIVVEDPDDRLSEKLTRFRRNNDGSGEYVPLYTLSRERNTLVTMPGFRRMVEDFVVSEGGRAVDRRLKMPDADSSATDGMPDVWKEVAEKALAAGGGIVSVPDMFGTVGFAASIIRSYPRDRLAERGTPICLVACERIDHARDIAASLRNELPGRDVRPCTGKFGSDGEDVIVASFNTMREIPLWSVGVLICAIGGRLKDHADEIRAEAVSSVRKAARWGVASSPIGGRYEPDMIEEGLFGPLVASVSYEDAVKAGIAMPVTVCWVPCPKPNAPMISAPLDILEKLAHEENKGFLQVLGDIVYRAHPDEGCVVKASPDLISRFDGFLTGAVRIEKKDADKLRRVKLEDLSAGVIRKALVEERFFPSKLEQALVVCSCGGADSVYNIPWGAKTKEAPDRKLYMVDFRHDWDVHNGRPGRLARNDDARKLRYRELGFSQILCDIEELPFL